MTFTHAISTNNYGPAKFIVDASAANGTHTTIASALTSSSSGDTIFIRPGTYTENLTLKAGVNLAAYVSDSSLNATGKVIISGTCTLTTAGSVTISGIQLQTNSANLLAVTGSVASIVNLNNCYLNCSNNTGISFTSSSASASINIYNCVGDIGTTGIALFASSSAGTLFMNNSTCTNSGGSSTANTISAGLLRLDYTKLFNPITSSSTATVSGNWNLFDTSAQNATSLTIGGSGNASFGYCSILSGSASAVSVSQTVTLTSCKISSSNTNVITGAGTLNYTTLDMTGTSNGVNVTTQAGYVTRFGIHASAYHPAFLAQSSLVSNVTGDGTTYTMTYTTEIYDQNNNFDATSTFTAPITGKYLFCATIVLGELGAAFVTGSMRLVASNRTITADKSNYGGIRANDNTLIVNISQMVDMDAADTVTIDTTVAGSTKTVDANANAYFSGYLIC